MRSMFKLLCLTLAFPGVLPAASPIFELDATRASGDSERWFQEQGWEFREDLKDMRPRFEDGAWVVEPQSDELGLAIRQFAPEEFMSNVRTLRIGWGVDQYPEGADWSGPRSARRNTRNAIAVMLFFGQEKQDSGSAFVPDLPYFLSFFLGENERPGSAYFSNYWQKGGRYFCIPCDGSTGKVFITEVDLPSLFEREFGRPMPPITGITIEVDVQNTSAHNGRHSKAFLRRISLSP